MRNPEHNPRGLFNFSFEFACGNKPNPDPGSNVQRPAFVTMLRELDNKIDFAILNGDWIYERQRDYTAGQWLEQVGATAAETPDIVQMAPSIVGVWENYKDYLATDPNLAAWHREIPSFFVFDDHEILNGINGTSEVGYRDFKAVFRDIGTKAWYDYLGWSQPPSFTQDIHFGMAKLRADNDVLYDENADFTALDFGQASNLMVHWGGQYAGTPNGARMGGGGDPNACVYEIAEALDKHRLRIRPAAVADTTSAYSIGRRSYTEKKIGNCHLFFIDTRSHRGLHDVKDPFKPGLSPIGVFSLCKSRLSQIFKLKPPK